MNDIDLPHKMKSKRFKEIDKIVKDNSRSFIPWDYGNVLLFKMYCIGELSAMEIPNYVAVEFHEKATTLGITNKINHVG